MKSLLTIALAILVSLTAFQDACLLSAADGAFLFPEAKSPELSMNCSYGEKAMEDKLYKNAIRYFTFFANEAKTTEERAKAARLLSKAYLLDNSPKEALKVVNDYLATQEDPTKVPGYAELFLTAGKANLLLKDYTTAMNFLEPLLNDETWKQSPELLCAVADIWNATARWAETTQALQDVIKSTPIGSQENTALAWRFLEASIGQGNWAEARSTLALLGSSDISDQEKTTLKLLQVKCNVGEGKIAEAVQFYTDQKLAEASPAKADTQWWSTLWELGQACQEKELRKEAADIFGAASKVAPTQQHAIEATKLQAECLIASGDHAQAKTLLTALHEQAPENNTVTIRLAETRKALGERRSASELFLKMANENTLARQLRYRSAMEAAQCLAQEGLSKEASDAYRLAATLGESTKSKSNAIRMAAEQAEKNGQIDTAIKLFLETADEFGDKEDTAAEARLEAGRLLLKANKADEALAQYKKFLEEKPNSPRQWEALLAIGKTSSDDAEALKELLSLARNCPDPAIGAAAFFEAHGRVMQKGTTQALQQALDILQEFLAKYPSANQVRIVRHKNIILGFQLQKPETTDWCTSFLKDYRDSENAPEITIHLGDWYAGKNDYANAASAYHSVADLPKATNSIKALASYEEAFCLSRSEDGRENAMTILKDLETRPLDNRLAAQVFFLKGDLLALNNDVPAAREAFEAAREKANKTLLAYAAEGRLAEILYATNDFETAKKYAEKIVRENPRGNNILLARAKLVLARCLHNLGNDNGAINEYQQIRLEYEASRENAATEVASPNVYVAAVSELLDILYAKGMRSDATIVRDKYNAIPGMPQLPPKK